MHYITRWQCPFHSRIFGVYVDFLDSVGLCVLDSFLRAVLICCVLALCYVLKHMII